jgi:hypothetical protein
MSLLVLLIATTISLPAFASGGHLDGVVLLAKDDVAALAQVRATPERHVMLYFGDQAN